VEIVIDGAHDGVDLVANSALEKVAGEMVIGFAVADDVLDGGAAPEIFLDLVVNVAFLS